MPKATPRACRRSRKSWSRLKPDCILGQSTPVTAALMQATRTIPIVFVSVSDPIGSGFVASMARPDGNMTGFTVLPATITGKYLSMLKEMVPQLARVAILYNPDSAPAAGTFFLTSIRWRRDGIQSPADHSSSAQPRRD